MSEETPFTDEEKNLIIAVSEKFSLKFNLNVEFTEDWNVCIDHDFGISKLDDRFIVELYAEIPATRWEPADVAEIGAFKNLGNALRLLFSKRAERMVDNLLIDYASELDERGEV